MTRYYVNRQAQSNGDHEVHVQGCVWMPGQSNQQYLGEFSVCREAVAEAKKSFVQVNGCIFCCTPCHTQ